MAFQQTVMLSPPHGEAGLILLLTVRFTLIPYGGDEKDPEFMYQDYENFPSGMASEYGFNWAYVEGYRLAREEGCEDAWYAWVSNTGDTCFEQFRGAWLGGPYDSELEFAAQYVDECGFLSEVPDTVARYFDYEAFARDLFMELDFVDGHVFHR